MNWDSSSSSSSSSGGSDGRGSGGFGVVGRDWWRVIGEGCTQCE